MNFPLSTSYTYNSIQNSKGIIIFVHGLTSSQNEEIFVRSEKYFNKNYYSTIRFNLYGDLPKERKLNEVSLQDNIDDVNQVITYCHKLGYEKIFLVGHSYGGIVNLYVNYENISGILMWDSSIGGPGLLEDVHEDESGEYYIDWGNGYRFYISEKLYRDFQIPSEEFLEKLKEIKLPIKIFAAENGLSKAAERYFEVANEPKELSIIKGAYHTFEDGGMEELLSQSLEWINNN